MVIWCNELLCYAHQEIWRMCCPSLSTEPLASYNSQVSAMKRFPVAGTCSVHQALSKAAKGKFISTPAASLIFLTQVCSFTSSDSERCDAYQASILAMVLRSSAQPNGCASAVGFRSTRYRTLQGRNNHGVLRLWLLWPWTFLGNGMIDARHGRMSRCS